MSSGNSSDTTGNPESPKNFGIAQLFIVVLVFTAVIVVTVFGNVAVILTTIYDKRLHKTAYLLVAALAVPDLITGLLLMPIICAATVNRGWAFGHGVCHVFILAILSCARASIWHVVMIALDRFLATSWRTYSLMRKGSKKRVAMVMVIFSWIIAPGPTLVLGFAVWAPITENTCRLSQNIIFMVWDYVTGFLTPMALIIGLYSILFIKIRLMGFSGRPQMTTDNRSRDDSSTAKVRYVLSSRPEESGSNSAGSGKPKSSKTDSQQETLSLHEVQSYLQESKENTVEFETEQHQLTMSEQTQSLQVRNDPGQADSTDKIIQNLNPGDRLGSARSSHQKISSVSDENIPEVLKRKPSSETPYSSSVSHSAVPVVSAHQSVSAAVSVAQSRETEAGLDQGHVPGSTSCWHRLKKSVTCTHKKPSLENPHKNWAHIRERKLLRILITLAASFSLLWLPHVVTTGIMLVTDKPDGQRAPGTVRLIMMMIGLCNSAVNPIVYTVFCQAYREAFKRSYRKLRFKLFGKPGV